MKPWLERGRPADAVHDVRARGRWDSWWTSAGSTCRATPVARGRCTTTRSAQRWHRPRRPAVSWLVSTATGPSWHTPPQGRTPRVPAVQRHGHDRHRDRHGLPVVLPHVLDLRSPSRRTTSRLTASALALAMAFRFWAYRRHVFSEDNDGSALRRRRPSLPTTTRRTPASAALPDLPALQPHPQRQPNHLEAERERLPSPR